MTSADTSRASLIFVCGPDEFLVEREARQHFEALTAEAGPDAECEVIDGLVQNASEVTSAVNRFRSAAQTVSLFGQNKVIWFRGVNFLADSRTANAAESKEQAGFLIEDLGRIDPAAVSVVLSASPVDRRKKEFKSLQGLGEYHFIEAGGRGGEDLAAMAVEEARRQDVRLDPGVAAMLVEKVGGNARLIVAEIAKLATYLNQAGAAIEEKHVNELVPAFGEGSFFEPVEAFYNADLEWSLDAVRRYFFQGHDARPLLSALQNRNRLLLQMRVLMDSGLYSSGQGGLKRAEARFAGEFGDKPVKSAYNLFSQNPYYIGRLARSLQFFTLRRLLRCQGGLIEAFTGILDHPNEQEGVLRGFVLRGLGENL